MRLLENLEELVDEPALADAGDADDRDELRRSLLLDPRERAHEQVELALAPDERRAGDLVHVDAEARAGLDRLPHRHGLRLPLGCDRCVLPVVDDPLGGAVGRLADEDCRRAEERHHCVADELLDRAAEPLELRAKMLVVRGQDRPHVLRIHRLGAGREPDQVGEEHRDDLPLLP